MPERPVLSARRDSTGIYRLSINTSVSRFFAIFEYISRLKMNNPEIKSFIRKYSDLFWYIPSDKKEDISQDVLVEFILNYGNMEAVKELFSIIGIEVAANHFFNSISLSERRKGNYHELTLNYFSLLFNRYAPSNTY
jgi:hypothetical protein